MAQMNISNTLWNDTQEAKIALSEQVFDRTVDWQQYHYIDKDGNTVYPFQDKQVADKFQSKLNQIILEHYTQFQAFLHSKLEPGVIDSWQDIEDFLEGISDDEAMKLVSIIHQIEIKGGSLNIRMSTEIPGMLDALSTADNISTTSQIDQETGQIQVRYTFE